MNDKSWIKLYRKARENNILQDHIAWSLFTFILLSVDRTTGTYTTGRYLLAEAVGAKPITVYKALKRLQKKYQVLEASSNNKKTTISVLNWAKYQHDEVSVTSKEHQSNIKVTLNKNKRSREVENKDIKSKDLIQEIPDKPKKNFGNEDVNKLLEGFKANFGYPPTDRKPRQWAYLLAKNKTVPKAIEAMQWFGKNEAYRRITTLESVYRKFPVYEAKDTQRGIVEVAGACQTCHGRKWLVGDFNAERNAYLQTPCPDCTEKKGLSYEQTIQTHLVA